MFRWFYGLPKVMLQERPQAKSGNLPVSDWVWSLAETRIKCCKSTILSETDLFGFQKTIISL